MGDEGSIDVNSPLVSTPVAQVPRATLPLARSQARLFVRTNTGQATGAVERGCPGAGETQESGTSVGRPARRGRHGAGLNPSPPTLRFWGRYLPEVVIGRFQAVSNELDEETARAYGVGILRRTTGGGAMFVEPRDVITYSMCVPLSDSRAPE